MNGSAQTTPRINEPIDDSDAVRLPNSTHPALAAAIDRGRVNGDLAMERIVLRLRGSESQQEQLLKFIDDVHDRKSTSYHHWLTPEDFAKRFGGADADLEKITGWLQAKGFSIVRTARSKQWIQFSGTAAQVESAFQTEIHRFEFNGEQHVANTRDISIPRALSPVVAGLVSLHDFRGHPLHTGVREVKRDETTGKMMEAGALAPEFSTSLGGHFLAPGDWARIYNTQPLLASGVAGSGISIAVVGSDSDIQLSDVRTFRQIFGLPENDPELIIDGTDPGVATGSDFEVEAALDVEWSGAIAPGAKIKFVTAASTAATFGSELALAHIVDNRLAQIITNSIGSCELFLGDSGNQFIDAMYRQAAAEGITVLVAAGDTGEAGCDAQQQSFPAFFGAMVNGFASTPFNVAIGGNVFAENDHDDAYWNSSDRSDYSSAIGYIPESVWNESCDPTKDPAMCFGSDLYLLSAGSGGRSNCVSSQQSGQGFACYGGYLKPAWQIGVGVPNDGARDLPDVALAAGASHDGYLVCVEGSCQTSTINGHAVLTNASVIGGTSAGAPSFAGALALLEQKISPYLGVINFDLYKLAASENLSTCDSTTLTNPAKSNSCIFYDITSGNNNIPGQTGVRAAKGFDLATGLGSINFSELASHWGHVAKLSSTTSLSLGGSGTAQHGDPIIVSVFVASSSGSPTPTGDFSLLASNGTSLFGGTLTDGKFRGNIASLPSGTYQVRAYYVGDGQFAPSQSDAITLNITPEDSVLSVVPIVINLRDVPIPITQSLVYGNQFGLQIDVTGKSGLGQASGDVTVTMDGAKNLGRYQLNSQANVFVWLSSLDGTGIEPGTHNFAVSYGGDASFNRATTAPVSISVAQGNAASLISVAQIRASVDPAVTQIFAGTPLEIDVTLGDVDDSVPLGAVPPTGTVQVFDCTDFSCAQYVPVCGPLRLSTTGFWQISGAQARCTTTLSPGTHFLAATYSGDEYYNGHGLGRLLAPVQPVSVSSLPPLLISLSQTFGTVPLGKVQRFLVRARSARSTNGVTSGQVFLLDAHGNSLTDPVTVVNGSAAIDVPQTHAGPNGYWALYFSGGPDETQVASNTVITTVAPGSTSIAVEPSTSMVSTGTPIDITATVLGSVSTASILQPGAEGGQVIFYDSVSGGPPQMLGGGPQTLTIGVGSDVSVNTMSAVLPPGRNVLSVKFLGTSDWSASSSASAVVTVESPARNTATGATP